jgi:hypothetical protein
MIIFCFSVILAFFASSVYAKPVSQNKAQNIALNLTKDKKHSVKLKTKKARHLQARSSNEIASQDVDALYYVFETGEDGFAIIAGDDVFKPVLGFSESGKFDYADMPPNFAWYLQNLEDEMLFALEKGQKQAPQLAQEWIAFAAGDFYTPGTYLLTTNWNQTEPYNNKTPIINDSSTYTGCTATAMSQIMNYHQYPAKGSGTIPAYLTKTRKLEILPINLDTVMLDWTNMKSNYKYFYNELNNYTVSLYTETEGDAVATLMSIAGKSIEVDYDTDGSGAHSREVATALRGYFDYDPAIQYIERDSIGNAWEGILKEQIDFGLPVYYAGRTEGAGHAFVLDGYNNSGNFHFNWGWGGHYNGWFISTVLTPGTDYDFSYNQDAIINIMPNQGTILPSNYNLRLSQSITLTNIKGDTINDNIIFQDSALIVKVVIHNSGVNDFFGKIIVVIEDEFDTEIIGEKYVSIPVSQYSYPFNFYAPKINSTGGDYKISVLYTTDDKKYYMVNEYLFFYQNPINVFVVGLYMPKLKINGNIVPVLEDYTSVDSLDLTLSNIGQNALTNLKLNFKQGIFASNKSIESMILPGNSNSLKFAPVLGLKAGIYKDTLVITGNNDVYLLYPLEFEVTLPTAIKWNSIIAEIPQNVNVWVYNIKGKLVAKNETTSNIRNLALPPGIYIVKIKGEKFNLSKKVIVAI